MTPDELMAWRIDQGWSREEVSEKIGSTPRALQSWELGDRPIPDWVPIAIDDINKKSEVDLTEVLGIYHEMVKVAGRNRRKV